MGYGGPKRFGGPASALAPPWANTVAGGKTIARGWYDRASALGADLTTSYSGDVLDSAEAMVDKAREITNPTELPALLDRWNKAYRGMPLSLHDIQAMDEGLGDLIDKNFKSDPEAAHNFLNIQTMLRQKIAGAGPGDIIGSKAGFDALNLARQAWSQTMKMSDLERIQKRALMTDNPASSIQSQMKNLITKARGYDADETAAVTDAANRGAFGGLMQRYGTRLWTIGGPAIGSTIGGYFGEPTLGALLGSGAGEIGSAAARNMATAIALRKMQNAFDVIGRKIPPDPLNFGPPP
jgi:hypothetical protein